MYLNVAWPDAITQPSYTTGTTLKLHATFGGQLQPINPRRIKTSSGPRAGPNIQESVYVVLNEYHVEWGRVTDLSSLDFSNYIGSVNEDTFMGVDAGQLLCAGVTLEPGFVLVPGSPLAWTAKAIFKQKSITDSSGTYGWNKRYNEAIEAWEDFTLVSGDLAYDTYDFSGIFS